MSRSGRALLGPVRRSALAALVALLHDLIFTVGAFALAGFEVSPASVIGFLTILGYSLYDTVVVFDKVRENVDDARKHKTKTFSQAANMAINQTLVRSINTSVVALLPVGAILVVGFANSSFEIAGLDDAVERRLRPDDVVLGETELVGDRVRHGGLVPLAVRRLVVDEPRGVGRAVGGDGELALRLRLQGVGRAVGRRAGRAGGGVGRGGGARTEGERSEDGGGGETAAGSEHGGKDLRGGAGGGPARVQGSDEDTPAGAAN